MTKQRNKYMAAEGGTEMLFSECANRAETENRLRNLFTGFGFSEVVTPTLEYYDLFSEGAGAIDQCDMYTLSDRLGRLLVLRPDNTKPIARLFASRLENLEFPVRLFYNQSVFRRNVAFARKSDEILQIGAELLGSGSEATDLEIISLAVESLSNASEDFLFELSHVGIYRKLMKHLGVSAELAELIREAIASKNYSELDELLSENNVPNAELIRTLPRLFGGEEVLEEATSLFSDPEILEDLQYLGRLMEKLREIGTKGRISFDLALVNEYNYYTGIVFKGYTEEGGEVLSGGRYDTLYSYFGLNVDAVGFAVNLDSLSRSVKSVFPELVLVACENAVLGLRLCQTLRGQGLRAALCSESDRDSAIRYGERIKANRIFFAESGESYECAQAEEKSC